MTPDTLTDHALERLMTVGAAADGHHSVHTCPDCNQSVVWDRHDQHEARDHAATCEPLRAAAALEAPHA